jgi:hypothetical protein
VREVVAVGSDCGVMVVVLVVVIEVVAVVWWCGYRGVLGGRSKSKWFVLCKRHER